MSLLESYVSKYLIGGDWNAKLSQWGARLITSKGRKLLEAMNRQNCDYLSTVEPTYWPSDYNKLPDLLDFFMYKGITTRYIHIESNHELSSDHTPVIAILSTHVIYKLRFLHWLQTEQAGTAGTSWNQ
jgi:endonuclease/exonuclease/phosphatase family metal-dependent hydrolase